MTIDEAIELTKQHNKCQFEEFNECASIECCSDCDNYYDEKEWDKFCKQLPELLEKLKAVEENTVFYSSRPIEDIVLEARADAIEECKQILLDAMARDGKTKCHKYMVAFNEMEKLKEQNRLTCFDCKHHFMSDCYLECQVKNRINNDNICENFEQLKEQMKEGTND